VALIRSGLADVIASKAARGTATVVVYLLDPAIEDAIAAHGDGTAPADGEEPLADRLCAAVRHELSYLPQLALRPAILTQEHLRRPLRELLRHELPRTTILSYGDLPPDFNVQPVARVTWA
jgi:type III secretory pathway component EscV